MKDSGQEEGLSVCLERKAPVVLSFWDTGQGQGCAGTIPANSPTNQGGRSPHSASGS